MFQLVRRYARWLHTCWPSGKVEPLPEAGENGSTSVRGLRIVGDLTGVPLLKFALDSGTKAVAAFVEEEGLVPGGGGGDAPAKSSDVVDVLIAGAGVSGVAAAAEAVRRGLSYRLYESAAPFATIVNFPKGKPIYTYPEEMVPQGRVQVRAQVKEELLAELEEQRRALGLEVVEARVERIEKSGPDLVAVLGDGSRVGARRVILAVGRSGNYRKLGVPGADLDKVSNRLHDPKDYAGQDVLVVGGGDTAVESATALAEAGARVTLSYRKAELSRPKPQNLERMARLAPAIDRKLESEVEEIGPRSVTLRVQGRTVEIPNDSVFAMVGREAPLDLFRRSGVRISGERNARSWATLGIFTALVLLVYLWKGWLIGYTDILAIGKDWGLGPSSFPGTLVRATSTPGFWFTSLYTACIVGFGIARIRRRRTPYVRRQTLTLMAIQVVPLFLLPEIVLPWMGANGWIPGVIEQNLFPNGEYWRALGFVLAWPLFLVNLASPHPMAWWLIIGFVQTFVLIPLLVWRWGKGAYCGWICSCGALAETLGDTHRHKMWHGPVSNRWNLFGQAVLAAAAIVTLLFMASWHPSLSVSLEPLTRSLLSSYKLLVDIVIGGAIGVGFYFWFSGRVWCRFACPLAALMHVYARFSRFRIFAEKTKCISCNVCTSVCHQGIDVMGFANKGLAMEDPQCVRCSACVQSCPTGVLRFGRVGPEGTVVYDSLSASRAEIRERAARLEV